LGCHGSSLMYGAGAGRDEATPNHHFDISGDFSGNKSRL
jgi:hypothetical protein